MIWKFHISLVNKSFIKDYLKKETWINTITAYLGYFSKIRYSLNIQQQHEKTQISTTVTLL